VKKILCLQHVPFEGPGYFRKAFEEYGGTVETRLVPQDGVPTTAPDALLVMGGPMSVNDTDPWLTAELNFIREQVARGVPFLGICLGSQLLAKATGGTVQPGPAPEIGMIPIRRTPEAHHDPLFAHFPEQTEVFAWHGEGMTLPEGAIPLAGSALYPVQAFRYGRTAYGLLFHLEVEAAGVDALCQHATTDLERAGRTRTDIERETYPHLSRLNGLAQRMIHRFMELIP
jgi:GMP synthase (glutamine-hydrolysing)